MRKIPALLAVLGLTTVGLAGCAIPAPSQACPRTSATDSSVTDLVTVTGDVGSEPTVSVHTPFHAESVAYDDLVTGTGPAVASPNQLLILDTTIVSGNTGKVVASTRYDGDPTAAQTFDYWAKLLPAFSTALKCATQGSRTVVALPPSGIGSDVASSLQLAKDDSLVAVVDLQKVYLSRAQGTLVYNDALGLPTVVRAPDGRPGIIVPDAAAPSKLVVQTLIKGDGDKVTTDGTIRIAYTGVTWKERTVFDTTWDGEPPSVTLAGVVPGLAEALKGATVGSQLLVVVPPDLASGANAPASVPTGSTLVYVVDILGVDAAAAG